MDFGFERVTLASTGLKWVRKEPCDRYSISRNTAAIKTPSPSFVFEDFLLFFFCLFLLPFH